MVCWKYCLTYDHSSTKLLHLNQMAGFAAILIICFYCIFLEKLIIYNDIVITSNWNFKKIEMAWPLILNVGKNKDINYLTRKWPLHCSDLYMYTCFFLTVLYKMTLERRQNTCPTENVCKPISLYWHANLIKWRKFKTSCVYQKWFKYIITRFWRKK